MTVLRCVRAVSAALVLGATLQACADYTGRSQAEHRDVRDATITAGVEKAFAQHSDLGAPNRIYVDTRDGVVYLSGIVENGLVTQNAITVASNVPGVKRIENNVSVSR